MKTLKLIILLIILFSCTEDPGLYTNTNNIIESTSVLYEDVPGIDKITTSKSTYTYNAKGFPVRVNNAEEYRYE